MPAGRGQAPLQGSQRDCKAGPLSNWPIMIVIAAAEVYYRPQLVLLREPPIRIAVRARSQARVQATGPSSRRERCQSRASVAGPLRARLPPGTSG
jgi:hypothetical protein